MRFTRHSLIVFLACGAFCATTRAELPQARLDRIFPLGGAAGSEVKLTIQGQDLDDADALHFDHPGLKAERLKANEFKVTIAADVPPGAYDVRAVGKYGISGGRLFAVSRGLAEVKEAERNDTPETAQTVPMNAAVNGESDGNGDDFYRFTAKKGERVTIDCQAFRLDSLLKGTLGLATASGKELAQGRPYFDRTDPLLDVVIPQDGEYLLRIHDAIYAGGHPYRLVLSTLPQLENAEPFAVVPGETVELTIFGRSLPGGKPAPDFVVLGLPLDQLTIPFPVPGDASGLSLVHPLPSASLNAREIQVRPKGLEQALNSLTLVAASAPVTREREPNDASKTAQELKLPAVVSGRFDRPGDSDWYRFAAKAGEAVAIDLACERMDRPGDPRVIVLNEKGQELANIDDHGIGFHALAMHNRDPLGTFNVPANGTYQLLVQDTYNNGGARFGYALRVGKPDPDFSPVVFHETVNKPTAPIVRQGGSAFIEFCLNRRDGFKGPATVEVDGLPPGVTCPPVHVSPQGEFAVVVFTAAKDAPEWSGAIRLKAWATIDGKRVEHPVRCMQRRWAIDNISTSRECREVCLAVRPSAPYGLKTVSEPQTVAAGKTLETKVTVERRWPDYKGKVQINGLDLPPGFNVPATDLAEGQNEVTVKLSVENGVPEGLYTIVFRGDAQVPFNRDPKATNKPNTRVADPSTPLTVNVTAPAKK